MSFTLDPIDENTDINPPAAAVVDPSKSPAELINEKILGKGGGRVSGANIGGITMTVKTPAELEHERLVNEGLKRNLKISPGDLKSKMTAALIIADELYGAMLPMPKATGPMGALKGQASKITSLIGMDPKVQAYNQQKDAQASPLAKNMGESGALAVKDIERAKRLVGDTSLPYETNALNAILLQNLFKKGGVEINKKTAGNLYTYSYPYRKTPAYRIALEREKKLKTDAGIPFSYSDYAAPIDKNGKPIDLSAKVYRYVIDPDGVDRGRKIPMEDMAEALKLKYKVKQ